MRSKHNLSPILSCTCALLRRLVFLMVVTISAHAETVTTLNYVLSNNTRLSVVIREGRTEGPQNRISVFLNDSRYSTQGAVQIYEAESNLGFLSLILPIPDEMSGQSTKVHFDATGDFTRNLTRDGYFLFQLVRPGHSSRGPHEEFLVFPVKKIISERLPIRLAMPIVPAQEGFPSRTIRIEPVRTGQYKMTVTDANRENSFIRVVLKTNGTSAETYEQSPPQLGFAGSPPVAVPTNNKIIGLDLLLPKPSSYSQARVQGHSGLIETNPLVQAFYSPDIKLKVLVHKITGDLRIVHVRTGKVMNEVASYGGVPKIIFHEDANLEFVYPGFEAFAASPFHVAATLADDGYRFDFIEPKPENCSGIVGDLQ